MWIWLALGSALLLGVYDVAKKYALKRNGVYTVLLVATAITTLFLSPFLSPGPAAYHLKLAFKAVLVTASWVSGMIALRLLPITTVSTFKASRPMFVVLFSIILFGERLNLWQWLGVAAVLAAIWLLSSASGREGFRFGSGRGFWALVLSVFTGVASALWDKHIISSFSFGQAPNAVYAALPDSLAVPLFVQSWTNLYITLLLAVTVLVRVLSGRAASGTADDSAPGRFRWDWTLLLIAVLITGADALYFASINIEGSLLSVISLLRRFSVIVTFALGAIIFREGKIKGKSIALAFMIAGIALLMAGSL